MERGQRPFDFVAAHKYCMHNKSAILASSECGCFYCEAIFKPATIIEWVEDDDPPSALCPNCGIDSVIGDKSGYQITAELLQKMKVHWFGEPAPR